MARNPQSMVAGEKIRYYHSKRIYLPAKKYKELTTKKSLLAAVNSRKASFNRLLESPALEEDERGIVNQIIERMDILRERIKYNGKKDKMEEPNFRFTGTGSLFQSV